MADKKDKNKKPQTHEERIVDSFPEDMLPGYTPEEIDVLDSSFADIVNKSGIRDILDRLVQDDETKAKSHIFLDAMIEKHSKSFNTLREGLKNDDLRRKIILEMAKRSKS